MQANQLPGFLAYAIYAVSARYVRSSQDGYKANQTNELRYAPHFGGYNAAVRVGQEYAKRARMELDIDEPSVEALQTLMLLSQASFQLGKGKKTFMLLSTPCKSLVFASLTSLKPLQPAWHLHWIFIANCH